MMKKLYGISAVLAVIAIAAALIKGANLAQVTAGFPEGETSEITEITSKDWRKTESGDGVFLTIPESASSAQVLEITTNWASVDVYLEDTLLYSFSDTNQELGRATHWIAIPEGSGGKRIILTSDSGAAAQILTAVNYLGTADAIRHHFFMRNLPILFMTIVDVMMAVVVALILIVLRHKLSAGLVQAMRNLLFFILTNALWLISDCGFLECFTTQTGLWALISYITFMIMPVFMVRFAQGLLIYRKKSLLVLGTTSLVLTAATLLLYSAGLAPLSTLLPLHQILMIADYITIYFLCDYEIRHYRIKRLLPVRNGVVLMGILVTTAILTYWKDLYALYPLFLGAGFICYIVCLTISVVQHSFYNLSKKAEVETYRRLAYKDVMTMVYNRSAFIEYQKATGDSVRKSAYVLFDINCLKQTNDTLGHQAGDTLIKQAAACIRETFEEIGNCYRIGGDEFIVVLRNIRSKADIHNLLENFEKQVWNSNKKLPLNQPPLSIAYGYSLAGEEPRTSEEMYAEADQYMYNRKRDMKASEAKNAEQLMIS